MIMVSLEDSPLNCWKKLCHMSIYVSIELDAKEVNMQPILNSQFQILNHYEFCSNYYTRPVFLS